MAAQRPPVQVRELVAQLPYPATRLVISQYHERDEETGLWAWIAVGNYYDGEGNCLWSRELFPGQLRQPLEGSTAQAAPGKNRVVAAAAAAARGEGVGGRRVEEVGEEDVAGGEGSWDESVPRPGLGRGLGGGGGGESSNALVPLARAADEGAFSDDELPDYEDEDDAEEVVDQHHRGSRQAPAEHHWAGYNGQPASQQQQQPQQQQYQHHHHHHYHIHHHYHHHHPPRKPFLFPCIVFPLTVFLFAIVSRLVSLFSCSQWSSLCIHSGHQL